MKKETAKSQRNLRRFVFILLIGAVLFSWAAILGHYRSSAPIKDVVRSKDETMLDEDYDLALKEAYTKRQELLARHFLFALIIFVVLLPISIFSWDPLYKRKRLICNLFRTLIILLSLALGIALSYLAHFLVHSYLFDNMNWYAYLANHFRINNIIVLLALFIIPLSLALGITAAYFAVNFFLFPPRDVKSLSYSAQTNKEIKSMPEKKH